MIDKCADYITNWLIKNETIQREEQAVYHYAVYSLLLTIAPLFMAILFGIGMNCVKQSIVLILPFMAIRKYSGGYHTKHAWTCLIESSLLLMLCIQLSLHVTCNLALMLITAGAAVSLMIFSPIDNENRVLSEEERIQYKNTVIGIICCFLLITILLIMFQIDTYAVCISIGIILSAGLQFPCIVQRAIKRTHN